MQRDGIYATNHIRYPRIPLKHSPDPVHGLIDTFLSMVRHRSYIDRKLKHPADVTDIEDTVHIRAHPDTGIQEHARASECSGKGDF